MCFFSQQSKSAQELEHRFNATFEQKELYKPQSYNGFQFPITPIITNEHPDKIQLFHWGLIPSWANDISIRKHTLNAKIETIHQKPSYKMLTHKRCLVLVDGFFEWKHLDNKGKVKQKYLITLTDNNAFALAGLYNSWINPLGDIMDTYTIITMPANALMSEIHNSKKRMPVVLHPDSETRWLENYFNQFQEVSLKATPINS